MIRLSRQRQSIPARYRGAGLAAKLNQLFADAASGRALDSTYWKSNRFWANAKPNLKAESRGRCAYCESDSSNVAHCDVEHFRPKSHYWWLAYAYDNYTFSCQLCNQSFKGDLFPLQSESRRLSIDANEAPATHVPDPRNEPPAAWLATLAAEKALLPHPYLDDPESWYAWQADDIQQQVTLIPASSSARARKRCEAAVTTLGLNRDDLLRLRYAQFKVLLTFKEICATTTGPAHDLALTQLRKYWHGDYPFTAMSRYFLRQWGLEPELNS